MKKLTCILALFCSFSNLWHGRHNSLHEVMTVKPLTQTMMNIRGWTRGKVFFIVNGRRWFSKTCQWKLHPIIFQKSRKSLDPFGGIVYSLLSTIYQLWKWVEIMVNTNIEEININGLNRVLKCIVEDVQGVPKKRSLFWKPVITMFLMIDFKFSRVVPDITRFCYITLMFLMSDVWSLFCILSNKNP